MRVHKYYLVSFSPLLYRIMMFGAVLYWHWEAMLISYLATRVITLPFDGIETLLAQSDFNIALNPGTSYEDSFKISTDPVWQAAWIGRIQPYLEEYIPMFGEKNTLKNYITLAILI